MRAALGQLALFAMVIAALGCDSRSHGPRRDGGATADGGTTLPPTGCVSSRICADRLDCEDGERCNTALAEPVCQRIRCGTAGSRCSEADLCADGLGCRSGVCSEGFDAVAACMSHCTRCPANCSTDCADAEAQYAEARIEADARGCVTQFDAVVECSTSPAYTCDGMGCDAEIEAFTACISGP